MTLDGLQIASGLLEASGRGASPSGAPEAISVHLAAAAAEARQRWPEVRGPDALAFGRFLGSRLPPPPADPLDAVRALRCEDLWLACAALDQEPAAVQAVTALHQEAAAGALAQLGEGGAARADVLQQVRARLWTGGPSGRPALASYRGRGSLRSWLAMVTLREGLASVGRQRSTRSFDDDALALLGVAAPDTETAYLKQRYQPALREAFRAALGGLSPRDRNLLRYQLVDGLSSEEVGRIYGVDRATVWRWTKRIEGRLARRTRLLLARALGTSDPAEVESVIRLARSQLQITMSDLLDTD